MKFSRYVTLREGIGLLVLSIVAVAVVMALYFFSLRSCSDEYPDPYVAAPDTAMVRQAARAEASSAADTAGNRVRKKAHGKKASRRLRDDGFGPRERDYFRTPGDEHR